jgi:hypothetical protein
MMEKLEPLFVYSVKKTQSIFFIKDMTDTSGNARDAVEKSNGNRK